MVNAVEKKVQAINEILGSEVVSADEKACEINVATGCGYYIICEDRQDMFCTLESMLEGMKLMQLVKGA